MRDPYRIFVNQSGKFEVVDMRTNPDLTRFVAETTSSWKKAVTAGQRRYYSTNYNFHTRGGTYLLSYGSGPCIAVNPSKGDYIPPGYDRVSRELSELFSGYDGKKCVKRCRLVPMHGRFLINGDLAGSRHQFCIYRNRPEFEMVPGWTIFASDSSSYYTYILTEGGLKCRGQDDSALLTQVISKELLAGRTSLRVRLQAPDVLPDAERGVSYPLSRAVILGTTPLVRGQDNVYTWEGEEPLTEDTTLTIEINGRRTIRSIEVLND
ncbi:hypothetical protein VPHD148_0236 [Vibrio phage D148]